MRHAVLLVTGCSFSAALPADQPIDALDAPPMIDGGSDSNGGMMMVVDLVSVADTFLRAQFPNENHATLDHQRVGSGEPATCCTNRAVYRFDLAMLPAGCTITKAELRSYYYLEDYPNQSPTLAVHRVTAEWVETQATWSSRRTGMAWTVAGGDYELTAAASVVAQAATYGFLTWDITALASAWHTGAQMNHGVIVIEPNDLVATRGRKFLRTREVANASQRPHLRVTCVSP